MTYPKIRDYKNELFINGEIYKVSFVRSPFYRTVRNGTVPCTATCDPETRTIEIKRGLGRKLTFEAWLHEVLHALEFEYDLKINHSLIYKLENPLASFFLDNF